MSTIALSVEIKDILREMKAETYEDAIKTLLIETNRLDEEKPKSMWISASDDKPIKLNLE